MAQVSELFIFPVKSCAGLKVPHFFIDETGPVWDRMWMIADSEGNFLSLRKHPKMSLIQTQVDEEGLTLGMGKNFFRVSTKNSFQKTLKVKIWNEEVEVALEPQLFSDLLGQFLGEKVKLVRFFPNSFRAAQSKDNENSQAQIHNPQVKFADSRPVSIINFETLKYVADNIQTQNTPSSMLMNIHRYRPNILIKGLELFQEEKIKKIKIGEVVLSKPKPCTRCQVININPETLEIDNQVLLNLAKFRKEVDQPILGSLWIPENQGKISVQDKFDILE